MSWRSSAYGTIVITGHEEQVEYPDDTTVDEIEQGGEPFTGHLVAGELNDEVADRSKHGCVVPHRLPTFESQRAPDWNVLAPTGKCHGHCRRVSQ